MDFTFDSPDERGYDTGTNLSRKKFFKVLHAGTFGPNGQ